jgi:DNA-binding MarR family transcriptional regulator
MTSKPFDPTACAVQLRAAVMHLSRHLRTGMQHDGLPLAMLSALGQLYRGGAMTPTELARREGVKLQSLTRLLAELEAEGWVERSVSAVDARQSLLAITPRGKKRLGAAAQGADVPLAQAIATRLNAQDQALLLRACAVLASLGDALQDAEPMV